MSGSDFIDYSGYIYCQVNNYSKIGYNSNIRRNL